MTCSDVRRGGHATRDGRRRAASGARPRRAVQARPGRMPSGGVRPQSPTGRDSPRSDEYYRLGTVPVTMLPRYAGQSYLAGIGIRSSISAGLGSGWDPQVMFRSITNGLVSGITNVALEWAYQSLDLSPLLESIAASTIGVTLEALLNHQDPLVNIGKRAGEYIMDLGTFGMYDPKTGKLKIDPWSQAVYISKVLDFARIIREADDPTQGLVTALGTYSSAIFHQQAIEAIVKEGGILAMVTGRAEIKIDTETGKEKKRLWTSYQKKYYADIDMQTGNLIEKFAQINPIASGRLLTNLPIALNCHRIPTKRMVIR